MSTVIVTLPTNPSSGLPTFPASVFTGLKLDVKRTSSFENVVSRAASGRETAVSWNEIPKQGFELTWDFLDNGPGIEGNSNEFDTLHGFWMAQHGNLLPFYLNLSDLTMLPADSQVDQQIGTGDGTTTNFQLCRSVGSYLEPIQLPQAGTVTVYVNGTLTSVTLLSGGIIQFASAPATAAVITAQFSFVYLCKFDEDAIDLEQTFYQLMECQSLKLRTAIL